VAGNPLLHKLADRSDEPFLGVALAGDARCLITGNVKHFPESKCQGMKVLLPSEFLEFYREQIRKNKPHG